MNKIALAVVISLLAGFAVGAWMGGEAATADRSVPSTETGALPESASAEERLARLEQIIAEEREARIALEDTLAMLFEEIERLEGSGNREVADRRESVERVREAARGASAGTRDWIIRYQERRVSRMVEGGFSEDEARRILQQESEAQYKAMQAAWEAQRNGETLDRFASMSSTQSILRSEIGDDAYARYLEVQGQPTAVNVTQVLGGSPGTRAGMQAGDQVVSYNGERIFSMSDLRNQTMQGEPGEEVVIEIDRDGMRMQLTMPRGPIGITGNGANVRSTSWWGG
ncbi:MAG: PDZ domain-containing protein [Gammaproteobacteria bacterium]|jgi:membrane-associated protease RseP (regulator of RpoE activity)|nr:PDZ domain-containing protein [Gammaproteobacteria bacterium]MDH3810649.1 PDZ domain-containing protein [Gammaproteobacteria bacterium]